MDRSIIDAANGGALGDMTPFEARCLIEKMASNSQQFNARSVDAILLATTLQKPSMARVCGIFTSTDHYSDVFPSLLKPRTGDHPETVLNPRNVSVITHRSSKQTEVPTPRTYAELEKEYDA
ncbi:hypothetical protein Lal_00014522 [Lupinus albus]|nr:hypothetical protein Lal_00014522 [Lupinus albus]